MLFQVVLHQAHPLPGSKVTELTAVAKMLLPPVLIQCWSAGKGLLAGPTLKPWVLFTRVSSQAGRAGAQEPTAGAVQGALSCLCRGAGDRGCRLGMPAQGVLLECCLRAELSLTLGTGKGWVALVAAVDMASDVVAKVATIVTEWTEMGGCFVMYPQPV